VKLTRGRKKSAREQPESLIAGGLFLKKLSLRKRKAFLATRPRGRDAVKEGKEN